MANVMYFQGDLVQSWLPLVMEQSCLTPIIKQLLCTRMWQTCSAMQDMSSLAPVLALVMHRELGMALQQPVIVCIIIVFITNYRNACMIIKLQYCTCKYAHASMLTFARFRTYWTLDKVRVSTYPSTSKRDCTSWSFCPSYIRLFTCSLLLRIAKELCTLMTQIPYPKQFVKKSIEQI